MAEVELHLSGLLRQASSPGSRHRGRSRAPPLLTLSPGGSPKVETPWPKSSSASPDSFTRWSPMVEMSWPKLSSTSPDSFARQLPQGRDAIAEVELCLSGPAPPQTKGPPTEGCRHSPWVVTCHPRTQKGACQAAIMVPAITYIEKERVPRWRYYTPYQPSVPLKRGSLPS